MKDGKNPLFCNLFLKLDRMMSYGRFYQIAVNLRLNKIKINLQSWIN